MAKDQYRDLDVLHYQKKLSQIHAFNQDVHTISMDHTLDPKGHVTPIIPSLIDTMWVVEKIIPFKPLEITTYPLIPINLIILSNSSPIIVPIDIPTPSNPSTSTPKLTLDAKATDVHQIHSKYDHHDNKILYLKLDVEYYSTLPTFPSGKAILDLLYAQEP